MQRAKILFLIPSLSGGGAERVLINLLRNLPSDRFDINLFTLFKDEVPQDLCHINYKYYFSRKFRGTVHLLKLFSAKFLFNRLVGDPSKYDIVISYLHSPTMRIVSGAYGRGPRLVNWIHNEFKSVSELSFLFRNPSEFETAMRNYDATIFVAESARQSLIKLIPYIESKSHTIYNTIDSDLIKSKSLEPIEDSYFNDKTFNIISVGRFVPAKAFDRLLRIVARLNNAGYNTHLHLLGQGQLYSAYLAEIKKLGIEKKVTFPGFVENPYKYVAKADLFVCSSIHEGFSTAVTESLIVGTPVISTLCSGMEELLGSNGEYGIITPNDEGSLTQAVFDIVTDKSKLQILAQKAGERGKQFDKSATVSSVIGLFNKLLCK